MRIVARSGDYVSPLDFAFCEGKPITVDLFVPSAYRQCKLVWWPKSGTGYVQTCFYDPKTHEFTLFCERAEAA